MAHYRRITMMTRQQITRIYLFRQAIVWGISILGVCAYVQITSEPARLHRELEQKKAELDAAKATLKVSQDLERIYIAESNQTAEEK